MSIEPRPSSGVAIVLGGGVREALMAQPVLRACDGATVFASADAVGTLLRPIATPLVMSGFDDPDLRAEAARAGAQYVLKPLAASQLQSWLAADTTVSAGETEMGGAADTRASGDSATGLEELAIPD